MSALQVFDIYDTIIGMQSFVLAANVILSVLLIVLVLVQRANTDAGGAFSSDSSTGAFRRRGAERTLYRSTVLVSILFAVSLAMHAFL